MKLSTSNDSAQVLKIILDLIVIALTLFGVYIGYSIEDDYAQGIVGGIIGLIIGYLSQLILRLFVNMAIDISSIREGLTKDLATLKEIEHRNTQEIIYLRGELTGGRSNNNTGR